MLEQADLTLSISKHDYKALSEPLAYRLDELARRCRQRKIPVIVVFEGWDASGKGSVINRLMRSIDPRGSKMHSIRVPDRGELLRPFLWRYAVRIPPRNLLAVFDRSWYRRVLMERVEGLVPEPVWRNAYEEINQFERRLADDGYLVVKFWLHISKKEQKRRFRRIERNPSECWKVNPEDWEHHQKYGEYELAVEEMLHETSTAYAPWVIVEAENKYFGWLKVFEQLVARLEHQLAGIAAASAVPQIVGMEDLTQYKTVIMKSRSFLKRYDLAQSVARDRYQEELETLQKEVRTVHHRMFMERVPAVAVFEGWDAAGKGGAIRRLLAPLDPRGFEVITTAAPNTREKSHHYLWRFWKNLPKAGHLAIYDRSWYGRVMVERVEGFCTPQEWKRAFREINEFEKVLVDAGMVLVKYWLHIDRDEQLRRFQAREETPHKRWKITEEDWRNRERWDDYEMALADMIQRTSTQYAPWTVVEANNKYFARLKVVRTFIEAVTRVLDDNRLRPPIPGDV